MTPPPDVRRAPKAVATKSAGVANAASTVAADIKAAGDNTLVDQAGAALGPKIPLKARQVIYETAIIIGAVGTGATSAAAVTQGSIQLVCAAIGGVCLAAVAFLAKTHLADPTSSNQ